MTDNLEIHILDVYKGDCIIISFPNGSVGIVDCSRKHGNSMPPSLDWIRENQIHDIEFICLTHPHIDHLDGMIELFQCPDIRIKEFWHTVDSVYLLMSQCNDGGTINSISEAREFFAKKHENIIKLFQAAYEKRTDHLRIRRVTASSDQFHSIGGVKITALSPHAEFIEKFEESVRKDVNAGFFGQEKSIFNQISAVLMLEWGDRKVVLGGDAPASVWKRIHSWEQSASRSNIASNWHVIKVAHHGAADSFYPGMWDHMLQKNNGILLVSSDGNAHPSEKFLKSCRPKDRIYCTRKSRRCSNNFKLHNHTRMALSRTVRRPGADVELCAADILVTIQKTGEYDIATQLNGPRSQCHR